MNGSWKALAAAFVFAGVVTAGATGAAGATKFRLYGNDAGAHCDGSGVTSGSIGGTASPGSGETARSGRRCA
jgi:hypothetical protein